MILPAANYVRITPDMARSMWMHISSPHSVASMFGSKMGILLMLWQAGDWQIHLLVTDDHPILGKQTKLPVDPVIQQYYTLIRLYSMALQLGLK